MADFSYDVFLSQNSSDKPHVYRLAERLRLVGPGLCFGERIIEPSDIIMGSL